MESEGSANMPVRAVGDYREGRIFSRGILVLRQISRSHFKLLNISLLISSIFVLGCFVKFLGIFGDK